MSLFVFQRRGCQEVHSKTSGPFRDGGTFGVSGAAAPLKNKKKMVVWVRCYKQATPLRGLHPAVGLREGDACKVQTGQPDSKTLREEEPRAGLPPGFGARLPSAALLRSTAPSLSITLGWAEGSHRPTTIISSKAGPVLRPPRFLPSEG